MIIAISIINALTFIMFVVDKYKAQKRKYRISEHLLLTLLFFGSVGGYLAMLIYRHKTRRWYFHIVAIIGLIVWSYVVKIELVK